MTSLGLVCLNCVLGLYWSADGAWLYYQVPKQNDFCIEKVPVRGDPATTVRCVDYDRWK